MKAAYEKATVATDAARKHETAKRNELATAETVLLQARPADVKAHTALVAKRDHAANELRLATLDRVAAEEAERDAQAAYYAAMREAAHVEADAAAEAVIALEDENAAMRASILANERKQHELFASKIHRKCRTKAPYPGSPLRFESVVEVRAERERRHAAKNPLAGAELTGARI